MPIHSDTGLGVGAAYVVLDSSPVRLYATVVEQQFPFPITASYMRIKTDVPLLIRFTKTANLQYLDPGVHEFDAVVNSIFYSAIDVFHQMNFELYWGAS